MRDFHQPGRSAVFAENGICATSHPLAAKTAIDLLQQGGNAVDAAIGASVLLGFCEPQMTGIGGDCFTLISRPGQPVFALNGSGRAPANIDARALRQKHGAAIAPYSADAVTIPGAVDAFCHLSKQFGRLGLEAVLAPAIHYAEHGVPVAPRVAFDWNIAESNLTGHARSLFLNGGQVPQIGEIFRAPGQAEVLRRIAANGRAAFYEGEVAEDMVASLQAQGGAHRLEDFASVSASETVPISGHYNRVELIEHPPNGQGTIAILMNNILTHFDLAALDPMGSDRAHIEAEAAKLAYDARNRFLADADTMTRLDHLLAPETGKKLAALIDPKRAQPQLSKIAESVHKETIYLTVIDRDLTAVSMIYSIFHSFGAGIASEKFGILFQNRGAGFTLAPGHPNEIGGSKRPMHTIIPAMLARNGEVEMSFGVMGGAYQPNGHARFVSNLVDYGMAPQQAIDAPRSFCDEGSLKIERGYDPATRKALAELGHNVTIPDTPIGGAQAILIDRERGVLQGASDPRKDGCALGY